MKKEKKSSESWGFYLFMTLPAFLLLAVVVIYPITRSFLLSFTEYNAFKPDDIQFVWFKNYTRMFADPIFWRAFKNNMLVVGFSLFGQIPIALILAYFIYRKMVRYPHFFQAIVFLPQVISTIVVGILWKWVILSPEGVVSALVKKILDDPQAVSPLGTNPATAMLPIGFVLIWMYTGFYMLIFVASLQKLDTEMFEAANIDGANELSIFFKIVLPALAGAIIVNMILAIAGSLKGFDLIWAMTKGNPADHTSVLPIYMYKYAFQSKSLDAFSYGSAVSMVIVFISVSMILLTQFIDRILKRRGL